MTIVIIASFQVIVNRCSQNNFEIVVIMNKMTSKALILSVFGVVLRENSASFSLFFVESSTLRKFFVGRRKTNQKRRKTALKTLKIKAFEAVLFIITTISNLFCEHLLTIA